MGEGIEGLKKIADCQFSIVDLGRVFMPGLFYTPDFVEIAVAQEGFLSSIIMMSAKNT
jgi:hypothetical protein